MTHVTHSLPEAASHGPALVPERISAHAFPLRQQLHRPPPVANHRPPPPGGIRQPPFPTGFSAVSIPVPLWLSLSLYDYLLLLPSSSRSPVFTVAVTEDSSSYLPLLLFIPLLLSHPCPSFKSSPFLLFPPPPFSLLDYRPCSFVLFY